MASCERAVMNVIGREKKIKAEKEGKTFINICKMNETKERKKYENRFD
jgi:hypothetical protein